MKFLIFYFRVTNLIIFDKLDHIDTSGLIIGKVTNSLKHLDEFEFSDLYVEYCHIHVTHNVNFKRTTTLSYKTKTGE